MEECNLKVDTSLNMKNDIIKNYEKIINCIEMKLFVEIIN